MSQTPTTVIPIEAIPLRLVHAGGSIEFPDPFLSLIRADDVPPRQEGDTIEAHWNRIRDALQPYTCRDAQDPPVEVEMTLTMAMSAYGHLGAWGNLQSKRFAPSPTSTPEQAS